MKTRYMQMLLAVLLLGNSGFGTTYAQSPKFSSFEYNQASNTVFLEWISSTNALYEMQASTNMMTGLWGQEGGWTNVLGTNPTNRIHFSDDGHPNGFFRLLARTNSPQQSTFAGMALRANSNLLFATYQGVNPHDAPAGSAVCIWDESSWSYICTGNGSRSGWIPSLTVLNNQSFFYFPRIGEDRPSEWSHAYIKDWRFISPEDLPVTGSVLIEWSAFESYSTPSNPIPDITVVDVTVINSDQVIVTNWLLQASDGSSVIWESQSNPDGYYTIKVDVAGLETIEKQVYLYN